MTTHDIDATLEKIDKDLAENEQPLPKAAPTQYGINNRPREIPQEFASLPGVDMLAVVNFQRQLRDLASPTRRLLQVHEQVFGSPADAQLHWFEIRCQDCGFRFRSQECVIKLAQLHANRNTHRVSLKSYFGGMESTLTIAPEKRTWGFRFLEFFRPLYTSKWWGLWCLMGLGYNVYGCATTSSGLVYGLSAAGVLCWTCNLLMWGIYKWKYARK